MGIEEKKNLITLINKSYWYRLYAIVFSVAGLGLFAYFYFNLIQKDVIEALKEPATVVTFIIPFLPGAILAYKAEKLQKKARKIIHEEKQQN